MTEAIKVDFSYTPLQRIYEAAKKALVGDPSKLQAAVQAIENAYEESQTSYCEVQQAEERYIGHFRDDIEIDDNPLVSRTKDGIWVNAWLWVPKEN